METPKQLAGEMADHLPAISGRGDEYIIYTCIYVYITMYILLCIYIYIYIIYIYIGNDRLVLLRLSRPRSFGADCLEDPLTWRSSIVVVVLVLSLSFLL